MNMSDPLMNLYPELIDLKQEKTLEFPGIQAKPQLVLLFDASEKMQAAEHKLLEKILGALGLDLEKVPIINLNEMYTPYREICKKIRPEKIIAFGITALQLQLNVSGDKYKILELGGSKLLFSHGLSDIMNDKDKKKLLWGALQQLFDIKGK